MKCGYYETQRPDIETVSERLSKLVMKINMKPIGFHNSFHLQTFIC